MAEQTKKQRLMRGTVVSDKTEKTIVVQIARDYRHPVLGKVIRSVKKYKVHDENEAAQVGDIVDFYEGRPVSKTKYMYLSRVVESAAK
ncbi:30S ribosomal protein S17 [Candidatus Babeliales bacterium]|nr:30S ribosomal protein S17 [Candidatus Babeliales bacterium]